MLKTILLARHAETGPAYRGRYIGRTDLPLGGRGPDQARILAGLVTAYKPQFIIASPMLRARQTVESIAAKNGGLVAHFDENLREIDFGEWEGKNFAEIADSDPQLVDRWAAFAAEFAFPGGEGGRQFIERVQGAAVKIRECAAERVLVVSHGGVVRMLLCHFLGIGYDNHLLFTIEPASLAVVQLSGELGTLAGLYRSDMAAVWKGEKNG
jgi:alpha-ribazole phosphatase